MKSKIRKEKDGRKKESHLEGTEAQKTDVKGEEGGGDRSVEQATQTVGGETMIDSSQSLFSYCFRVCAMLVPPSTF